MIYDTQVGERCEKRKGECHTTDSTASKFLSARGKNSRSISQRWEVARYSYEKKPTEYLCNTGVRARENQMSVERNMTG